MVTKTQFSKFKSQVKKRGKSVQFSFEDYQKIKLGECHYCGIEYYIFNAYCRKLGFKTPYMTIDRKDNSGNYTLENCVPACFVCNRIKGNFFNEEEMRSIGTKFVRPKFNLVSQEVWEEYLDELYEKVD